MRKVTHSTRSSDTLLSQLKQIASEVIDKDVSIDAWTDGGGAFVTAGVAVGAGCCACLYCAFTPDHPMRAFGEAVELASGSGGPVAEQLARACTGDVSTTTGLCTVGWSATPQDHHPLRNAGKQSSRTGEA